jgi:hypothetical protein
MTSRQTDTPQHISKPSEDEHAEPERPNQQPSSASGSEANPVSGNHNHNTNQNDSIWLKIKAYFANNGLAICALIVSGATAVYAYKQTSIAEKALIAGQRAFVYLDKIEARWVDTKTAEPGKVINITFFIGNSGNTPTRDLRMVGGCYPLGPELPREPFSDFKWDEKRIVHLVIAPHQILAYPACKLTEREIDPLQSSPFIQRYFMGEIRYFDIVSDPAEERVTQFVHELAIHDFNSKTEQLNYETLLAGLHNCSDGECKNAKGDPGALAAPRWVVR